MNLCAVGELSSAHGSSPIYVFSLPQPSHDFSAFSALFQEDPHHMCGLMFLGPLLESTSYTTSKSVTVLRTCHPSDGTCIILLAINKVPLLFNLQNVTAITPKSNRKCVVLHFSLSRMKLWKSPHLTWSELSLSFCVGNDELWLLPGLFRPS